MSRIRISAKTVEGSVYPGGLMHVTFTRQKAYLSLQQQDAKQGEKFEFTLNMAETGEFLQHVHDFAQQLHWNDALEGWPGSWIEREDGNLLPEQVAKVVEKNLKRLLDIVGPDHLRVALDQVMEHFAVEFKGPLDQAEQNELALLRKAVKALKEFSLRIVQRGPAGQWGLELRLSELLERYGLTRE